MAGVATCHRGTKSRLNDEVEDDVRDIERAWQPKGNGLPATRQVADIGTYGGNRYKDDNALRDYLNGGVETSQGLMSKMTNDDPMASTGRLLLSPGNFRRLSQRDSI